MSEKKVINAESHSQAKAKEKWHQLTEYKTYHPQDIRNDQPQNYTAADTNINRSSDIEGQIDTTTQKPLNDNKTQQPHRPSFYRPDIDGIRAVAIMLVLIYHAFPKLIPGGFIGVDVFFVISGYLISQIIIKEVDKQKFSIINFYCRRIKRIYPALILVLSFSLWVISRFWELDLALFSLNTMNSSLVFAANLQILMHDKDYFDADIRGNPLLHLWSLGVEEQFYIVWPFLLVLVLKFFRSKTLKILIGYTLFSFILSIVYVFVNSKFAFYFPLCRFWQMSVGGILGYLNLTIRNKNVNNALSAVGLSAILITSFVINDQSLFPGFWALIPTFSCAFIIQARNQSVINKYVLSSRPFTYIGKISYSLYLWHWPLLVCSRVLYHAGSKSLLANTYFIIFLTFVLTILTYYIAQDPIRKMKSKKIVVVLLICMGIVGLASLPVRFAAQNKQASLNSLQTIQFLQKVNSQMIPGPEDYVTVGNKTYPNLSFNKNRIKPDNVMQVKSAYMDEKLDVLHGGEYLLEKPVDNTSKYADMLQMYKDGYLHNFAVANQGKQNQLFLIGDSHIMKMTYHFQQMWRKRKANNTLDTFPTILTALRRGVVMGEDNSLLNFTRVLVHKYKPKRILFAWNWIYYFCKDLKSPLSQEANCDHKMVQKHVPQFISFLLQIQSLGIQVFTVGVDINHIQYSPMNMFDVDGIIQQNIKPFRYSEYRNKYKFIYDSVQTAMNNAKIKWIDSAQHLCWEDICHVVSPKGYAPYIDIDHMGKFYSRHWFTCYDHLVQF